MYFFFVTGWNSNAPSEDEGDWAERWERQVPQGQGLRWDGQSSERELCTESKSFWTCLPTGEGGAHSLHFYSTVPLGFFFKYTVYTNSNSPHSTKHA